MLPRPFFHVCRTAAISAVFQAAGYRLMARRCPGSIEYLHHDFAKNTYSFPNGGGANAATMIDVVRAGLSYKF